MYSGDECYDETITSNCQDEWDNETYCDMCGEPLDVDDATWIYGEMRCDHCVNSECYGSY